MGAGTSFRRSPFSSTRPDSGIQARLHVTLSGLQRRRKVAFWVDLTLDPPASERLESDLQRKRRSQATALNCGIAG